MNTAHLLHYAGLPLDKNHFEPRPITLLTSLVNSTRPVVHLYFENHTLTAYALLDLAMAFTIPWSQPPQTVVSS